MKSTTLGWSVVTAMRSAPVWYGDTTRFAPARSSFCSIPSRIRSGGNLNVRIQFATGQGDERIVSIGGQSTDQTGRPLDAGALQAGVFGGVNPRPLERPTRWPQPPGHVLQ